MHFKGRVVREMLRSMTSATTAIASVLLVSVAAVAGPAARAQSEGWILAPGSRVDQNSTVVPTNCVTASDGSVSCDTTLESTDGRTPARPYYNPFDN